MCASSQESTEATDRRFWPEYHYHCGQGSVGQSNNGIQLDILVKAGLAQKQSLLCSNQCLLFFLRGSRKALLKVFNYRICIHLFITYYIWPKPNPGVDRQKYLREISLVEIYCTILSGKRELSGSVRHAKGATRKFTIHNNTNLINNQSIKYSTHMFAVLL